MPHYSARLPPLPSFFKAAPVPSDPSLHRGRQRSRPHTENSWATHVYVKVPVTDEIQRVMDQVTQHDDSIHPYTDDTNQYLHISLSRCLFLREHQLQSFTECVRRNVSNITTCNISFAQVSLLSNDEKTRSFVTLEVGAGYHELVSCLKSVDKVVQSFHQPVFYKPPRFHASIAWSLKLPPLESAIASLPESLEDKVISLSFPIDKIIVKMGNRIVDIGLKTKEK
ncbi:U6 snRNA phosphodiesterase Usb1 [Radiomyces spectabilis]|uniref:U6 snRNA phosphodiesterase Usb1 n=1 Tax=Radiomyces spectabilis TaxID=64574 RepID=UPI00221F031B|nr:U6 snRNA phosphodiesterase Usb1 [Radiomyces spectabilis]KAI8371617.1 U6 snRNA phosphodiesterase Usb1 [Radiomyces spectabilis]